MPRFVCDSIRNNVTCIGLILKANKNWNEKLGSLVQKGFAWDRNSFGIEGKLNKRTGDDQNPFVMCRKSLAQSLTDQINGTKNQEEMIASMFKEFNKQFKKNYAELTGI